MGTGVNFIRAVLQIERSVNEPLSALGNAQMQGLRNVNWWRITSTDKAQALRKRPQN